MFKKSFRFVVFLLSICSLLLSACSDSNDEEHVKYIYSLETGVGCEEVKAIVEMPPASKATRSIEEVFDTENKKISLNSFFDHADKLMVYDVTNAPQKELYTQLHSAVKEGEKEEETNFYLFNYQTSSQITTSTEFAGFYPGFEKDSKVFFPKGKELGINLMLQEGTVEALGKKYDLHWAKKNPSSVSDAQIKINFGEMKRLNGIWAFRFANKEGSEEPQLFDRIDKIRVIGINARGTLDLTKGTIKMMNEKYVPTDHIQLVGSEGKGFGSEFTKKGKYIYCSLLPGNYTKVSVEVCVGDDVYIYKVRDVSGKNKVVNIEANKVYRDRLIFVEKITRPKSIEVAGVEWAPGNFVWMKSENSYCIAPSQAFIAGGGETQHIDKYYDNNDLDLFRFGTIETALNIEERDYCHTASYDIMKRWFVNDCNNLHSAENDKTTEVSKAKYGDLPYYVSVKENWKDKYILPSRDQIQDLEKEDVNIKPVYWSNGSEVVYGIAFWNSKEGEEINRYAFNSEEPTYENFTAEIDDYEVL